MDEGNFNTLLNKIHVGVSPQWLENIPNNVISLTITSPPYYDSELYTLKNGDKEFGWGTYEEYIEHLVTLLKELFRITQPSGRAVLVLSNTPQTNDQNQVTHYWPIIHDLIHQATKLGWQMIDEAIWVKPQPMYTYLELKPAPETQLVPEHDTITVLRKPGKLRTTSKKIFTNSTVWELSHSGPIKKYNKMYPSFPNKLVSNCIEMWSLPNDIVLDPYAGSGQVPRIAISLNRFAIGVESDIRWSSLWNDIS